METPKKQREKKTENSACIDTLVARIPMNGDVWEFFHCKQVRIVNSYDFSLVVNWSYLLFIVDVGAAVAGVLEFSVCLFRVRIVYPHQDTHTYTQTIHRGAFHWRSYNLGIITRSPKKNTKNSYGHFMGIWNTLAAIQSASISILCNINLLSS